MDEQRKKVMAGLMACGNDVNCGERCPYEAMHGDAAAGNCIAALCRDALALLQTKPARLLTLSEALEARGTGWEEIWFDADEEEGTAEHTELFPCAMIGGHYVCEEGDIGEVDPETYNAAHHSRLWTGDEPPTEEQRQAEEWQEGDEMDG